MSQPEMSRRAFVISAVMGGAMVSTLALAKVATPTAMLAQSRPAVDLHALVPGSFSNWREDRSLVSVVVNPQAEATLKRIYADTLSRIYINERGERIMLSIAYGSDQGGESTQAHRPEICYAAQGFSIRENQVGTLKTERGDIPVRRLVAVNGARNEPLTYWVTVGDKATLPGFQRKLTQLAYSLNGTIPDGLIFRVSSIQPDAAAAYQLQDQFVNALFGSISEDQQVRLAGHLEKNKSV